MLNPNIHPTHPKEQLAPTIAAKFVLVIHESEDDSLGDIVSVCLHHIAGWSVISLCCTQEALDRSLTRQPNAILFNVLLSKIDAISSRQKQIIHILKHHPLTQASPILLLTDKASWFTAAQLQASGIAGAIAKPFDPTVLSAQIARILRWT